VVLLGKGDHEVTSSWTNPHGHVYQTMLGITWSNITIIGQGIGETTILGGIGIHNKQNITMKQLTLTNTTDVGMAGYEAAKVTYGSTTQFDLTVAGSTWFSSESTAVYGVNKSFVGGSYTALILAECIAK
jgi:hypothetical protein